MNEFSEQAMARMLGWQLSILLCGLLFICNNSSKAEDPVLPLPSGAKTEEKPKWKVPAEGQMWAETKHDFGVAPRGSKLHYRFIWRNTTNKPLHLAELKRSCGCTEATANPPVVQPSELGNIEVVMDTRPFNGSKTVTLNLIFGGDTRPITQMLTIVGYSRGDIVYNPSGSIQFGNIDIGATPSQTIEIEYAGTLEWRMEKIAELPEGVEARFEEHYRRTSGVGYKVHVTLKNSLAVGEFKKTIQFKTNDPTNPVLPVLVEGIVRPAVTIVPTPLFFGSNKSGQLLTRRVTIRAKEAFTVLGSENKVGDVTVTAPQGKNVVHSLVVQWRPKNPGEMSDLLKVQTDIPNNNVISIPVQGTAY